MALLLCKLLLMSGASKSSFGKKPKRARKTKLTTTQKMMRLINQYHSIGTLGKDMKAVQLPRVT